MTQANNVTDRKTHISDPLDPARFSCIFLKQRHVEDESGGKHALRLSKNQRTIGDAAVVMRVDYAAWEFQ
ncbi:hypothetical protein PO909_026442 [Leuciscus waleckii]